jgi:hypothetical protein
VAACRRQLQGQPTPCQLQWHRRPCRTQFNVLYTTWKKVVKEWYESQTCSKAGCVCKEPGFLEISSQKELWAFLYRGECAPQPDPTRAATHVMEMPDLKWEKEEDGRYFMKRAQYDAGNDQL